MKKLWLAFSFMFILLSLARQASASFTVTPNPANGATGVSESAAVTLAIVSSSNALNTTGSHQVVAGTNVFLSSNSTCSAAVSTSNSVAYLNSNKEADVTMTPTASLTSGATYYLCVINSGSVYISDTSSNKVGAASSSFTVRDYSPPYVVANTPNVPIVSSTTPSLSVTFNDATIDLSSVTGGSSGTVTLQDTTGGVAGPMVSLPAPTLNTPTNGATFNLGSALTSLHTYTVNLATGAPGCGSSCIHDKNSNPLQCTGKVCSWSFTVDNTAPVVQSYTPATSYVTTTSPVISATFSEPIDSSAAALNTTTFKMTQPPSTTAISGSYAFASGTNTASFTPSSALTDGKTYNVALASGTTGCTGCIRDTASPTPNILSPSAGYTWSFVVDATHPVVSTVSPASGASNVSVTAPIVVNFTESVSGMKVSSLNGVTVSLASATSNVPLLFANSGTNNTTLTLTTPGGLDYNTTYTVTLSQQITDNAGNGLAATGSGAPAPYSWSFTTQPETPNSYTAYPPFLCNSVLPNVLIVLDNSNSFDEDLNNNAIGSPHCTDPTNPSTCSKAILARQVLTNIINTYSTQMNIGIMSYKLPSVSKYALHNTFYFNSYDPKSYCPTPPADGSCNTYCVNEDPRTGSYTPSAAEAACNSGCRSSNALFTANYRDPITTTAGTSGNNGTAIGSARRKTYCADVYPKTQQYKDPAGVTLYYGAMPGTNYASSNQGTDYLYSSGYTPADYPSTNSYNGCSGHSGTADTTNGVGFSGCSGAGSFVPTDDDYALGFYNFGSRMYWYYTSQTFYATGTPPGIGYLNVPIAAPSASQTANLLSVVGGNRTPVGFLNDETGYMSCTSTNNPNPYYATGGTTTASGTCSYIVNAGLTPTAGTFNSATSYFNGTLNQGSAIASPIVYPCQKNFVIYVTDGSPSVDAGGSFGSSSALMPAALTAIDALRCPTSSPTSANCKVSRTLNGVAGTYDVLTYVLGVGLQPADKSNVDQMAQHGGTADADGHTYYADDPNGFTSSLYGIFQNILSQVSSGTAASILNNSQGSGASLLQAMFYPSKTFDNSTKANWIGELQNLWYYVDPSLQNSTVREDSNKNYRLDLQSDKIVQFYFDLSQNKTLVNRFSDNNGDGLADAALPDDTVSPDTVNSLWRAGRSLWNRNLTSDPRTIYTGYRSSSGATPSLFGPSLFASSADWNLLQIPAGSNSYRQAKATTLLNYLAGADQPMDADGTSYRSRLVTNNNCGLSDSQGCTREWKLGDIISSTPKLVSNLPLGTYQLPAPAGYGDSSYALFVASSGYKTRGMAFVGGNDGMLHAFKLGLLKELGAKKTPAQLTDSSGAAATAASNLGREEWAYVPTGVLPYLTYYTNPSYNHVFYVDRTPTVVDASIGMTTGCSGDYSTCTKDFQAGSNWRSILIGGMGYGGASRPANGLCNGLVPGPSSTTIPNCIQSPVNNGGLSSYFALDVTDPENPKYLWEFSGDASGTLGAATSGPAIVRIASRDAQGNPDNSSNGKWYAIFASGPTGPIDTVNHQFYGYSDQNLKIFVVDLATGNLVKTFDTGIANAFAGSITSNVVDTDRAAKAGTIGARGSYSDDVIYIGYTQLDTSTASAGPPASPGTWTKGGVLRLTTSNYPDPNGIDPVSGKPWTVSTLIANTGPVTTAVSKLQDLNNKNLWIYFGTGRYFYKNDDPSSTVQQQLYGVREPCYGTANRRFASLNPVAGGSADNVFDPACTDPVTGSIVDQSGSASTAPAVTLAATDPGWTVKLDAASGSSYSERVITDSIATSSGAVFFTTLKPSSDSCAFGGNALIWAVNYSSGAAPPAAAMQGSVLLQTSTGAFAQLSLQTALANPANKRLDGRRLANPIIGVPPTAQGLSVIGNPKPVKKIVHIREK